MEILGGNYENYDKPCGEVFLTAVGDFTVHCTMCETKFHGFSEFAEHFHEAHIFTHYEEDYLEDYESNDQQSLCDDTKALTSLFSEDDLNEFEEVEFLAPEPEDCKEIEDFVRSFEDHKDEQNQNQFIENSNKRTVRRKTVKKSMPQTGVIYTCPHCDATSHSRKSMNEHKLRHKGNFKHKCNMCNKAFFSTSELIVHVRTHTGTKPYLCSDCGHKCTTASALRAHIRSCRDIRDAQCQVCSKMFRNEMYLRRHMIAHSDERAFSCAVCQAKFKQKKALQSHIKIHDNQHGYKCDMCPASFNQRPGLYSHMKSKHKHFVKAP